MSGRDADLSKVRTVPIARRQNKVRAEEFAGAPGKDLSFAAFLKALPDALVARDFLAVANDIAKAAGKRAVVVMTGGHIVKTGLAPVLIDLMRRGVITHLAMNGSAAIHDYEIARWGGTSEDVAAGLKDGTFGMSEETGRGMNEAFIAGMKAGQGMGEALANALRTGDALVHPELSLIVNAAKLRSLPGAPANSSARTLFGRRAIGTVRTFERSASRPVIASRERRCRAWRCCPSRAP